MKDYCSAHLLVSEPSGVSEPNAGLAADYHIPKDVDFPTIHPVFTGQLPGQAANRQPPALPLSYPGMSQKQKC